MQGTAEEVTKNGTSRDSKTAEAVRGHERGAGGAAGGWLFAGVRLFTYEYKHSFPSASVLVWACTESDHDGLGLVWSTPMRLAIPSLMAKTAAAAIGRTHAIGMSIVSFPHRDSSR